MLTVERLEDRCAPTGVFLNPQDAVPVKLRCHEHITVIEGHPTITKLHKPTGDVFLVANNTHHGVVFSVNDSPRHKPHPVHPQPDVDLDNYHALMAREHHSGAIPSVFSNCCF